MAPCHALGCAGGEVSKASQPFPRCSKPFQGIFWEKKIVYFWHPDAFARASGKRKNQPKSTLPCKKAGQIPANAGQKMKSPLDLGCEEMPCAILRHTVPGRAVFHAQIWLEKRSNFWHIIRLSP
jgi:hypothetical protein